MLKNFSLKIFTHHSSAYFGSGRKNLPTNNSTLLYCHRVFDYTINFHSRGFIEQNKTRRKEKPTTLEQCKGTTVKLPKLKLWEFSMMSLKLQWIPLKALLQSAVLMHSHVTFHSKQEGSMTHRRRIRGETLKKQKTILARPFFSF